MSELERLNKDVLCSDMVRRNPGELEALSEDQREEEERASE